MEYVFGANNNRETLRTKGDSHSCLTGYCEVVREYPDRIITDHFRVIEKCNTKEDTEGNCYDWYVIDNHYRDTDRYTPQVGTIEQTLTDLEIAAMEQEQMITDNEIAIMELRGK